MRDEIAFPLLEDHLPEMMGFVAGLLQEYRMGGIQSWGEMAERVHAFFTPEVLAEVDAVAPGWREMSCYVDGLTLVHVLCVFTGLLTCPEYENASAAQQALMKWIVLCHDIAKVVRSGQRDHTHSFRSAATTGAILQRVGFPVTAEYDRLFDEWFELVNTASTQRAGMTDPIQDNRKLPAIIGGIEQIFGHNSPAALIVKAVLLHTSITVVAEWPQVAPLTDSETSDYVDAELFPLLKMMMLADSDGWTLFDPPSRESFRQQTLAVFGELASTLPACR